MAGHGSQWHCELLRHSAVWQVAILVFSAATGCNPYQTPQTIDPATELKMSDRSMAIGSATLRVPHGWTAEIVERFDEEGRPLTVSLARCDKRGKVADMLFEVLEDRPTWRGNVDVSETSTAGHGHVVCDVTEKESPSGDDTPGHFTVVAYVERGNRFWYMYATFLTPVRPDLLRAVGYIDAVVFK